MVGRRQEETGQHRASRAGAVEGLGTSGQGRAGRWAARQGRGQGRGRASVCVCVRASLFG